MAARQIGEVFVGKKCMINRRDRGILAIMRAINDVRSWIRQCENCRCKKR
ncbi:hypothetical protein [Halomicronema sp. CCY15110]|nr:hypothetical protein [Halomicronema sp. CCY15110]